MQIYQPKDIFLTSVLQRLWSIQYLETTKSFISCQSFFFDILKVFCVTQKILKTSKKFPELLALQTVSTLMDTEKIEV